MLSICKLPKIDGNPANQLHLVGSAIRDKIEQEQHILFLELIGILIVQQLGLEFQILIKFGDGVNRLNFIFGRTY